MSYVVRVARGHITIGLLVLDAKGINLVSCWVITPIQHKYHYKGMLTLKPMLMTCIQIIEFGVKCLWEYITCCML